MPHHTDMCACIVIPAYQPGEPLADTIAALRRASGAPIIVVNDGSTADRSSIFETLAAYPAVHVVHHAINLGKGAALKTGLNFALCEYPDAAGIVTADADGQHAPSDIIDVAELLCQNPTTLILGVRRFNPDVPLRSRFGNYLTVHLVHLLLGQRLTDTQTGLRALPRQLAAAMLKVPSTGYEFELDMLVTAKHQSFPILQHPIKTIYHDGNRTSHFNPIRDSIRIYYVLLRFTGLSIFTALLDNAVFTLCLLMTASLGASQVVARFVALILNYWGARRAVFLSNESHERTLPKYLALVTGSGLVSYAIMTSLVFRFHFRVLPAKFLAETALFIANFAIQRDFVFIKRRTAPESTDWDTYYKSVPVTAKLTRRYTTSALVSAFRKYLPQPSYPPSVVELGGANSCFLDRIIRDVAPKVYHVVDNNEYGLALLKTRPRRDGTALSLHLANALTLKAEFQADVVFSVGLIEHFSPEDTRRMIETHFRLARKGGLVVISFPTPTWLYRFARTLLETMGIWKFPDERPLRREEVLPVLRAHGDVLRERVLWSLVLTQRLVVVRSHL